MKGFMMAWRDLAIVGLMKKFLGHKDAYDEHIVVRKVEVKKTVVPEPVTGALVVKKEYSIVTAVVETPPVEELVPETVKEEKTVAKATAKETPKSEPKPQAKAESEKSEVKKEPAQVTKPEKTVEKKETPKAKNQNKKESGKVAEEKKEATKTTGETVAKAKTQTPKEKSDEKPVKKEESVKVEKSVPKENAAAKEPAQKSTAKSTATKKESSKSVKEAAPTTQSVKTTAKKSTTAASKKSGTAKAPSKRAQKLELYHNDIMKHLGEVDDKFLEIIVKNLGPSIYNKDAETVACSDPKELETVKNNFLVRKLKMPKNDKEALDKAVAEVCEKLKGVKNKYRATFYYMLAKNLKRESRLR